MRGEDPAAIRIFDLQVPTRPEVKENNIKHTTVDVTDPASLKSAFNTPWPDKVAKQPLTVFYCVAFILAAERSKVFLDKYIKVNVQGAKNAVSAAKAAGCSIFIATSSGSVGVKVLKYFTFPWQSHPENFFQILDDDGIPKTPDVPLHEYPSCYSYSKALMEAAVCGADSPSSNFRTGCLRPGQAITGNSVENPNTLSWDYLRRGGVPTWLYNIVINFIDAQNASIAHLAYENRLLNPKKGLDVGGRAYFVTDPNPPVMFKDVYLAVSTLVDPRTPVKFTVMPVAPFLLLSHLVEAYSILRQTVPMLASVLPPVSGDLLYLQPAIFSVCTSHVLYVDERAKKELGYNAPINTLDSWCMAVADWNKKLEKKMAAERKAREEEALSASRDVVNKKDVIKLHGGDEHYEPRNTNWMGLPLG